MKTKTMNYLEIDWKTCHTKMTVLQARLVEAHRAKDARRVKDLQRNIVTSFAARALAVRRVTSNKGGNKEWMKWDSPRKKMNAINKLQHLTQNPGEYKAKPVKRMFIPKPDL